MDLQCEASLTVVTKPVLINLKRNYDVGEHYHLSTPSQYLGLGQNIPDHTWTLLLVHYTHPTNAKHGAFSMVDFE